MLPQPKKATIVAIAKDPSMTIMYALLDAYMYNLSKQNYVAADEILAAYQACAEIRWPLHLAWGETPYD